MKKNILIIALVLLSTVMAACGDGGSVLDLNPVEIAMEYVDESNPCGALEFNPDCK